MVLTVEGKSACSLVTKLSVSRWILAFSDVCWTDPNKVAVKQVWELHIAMPLNTCMSVGLYRLDMF